MKTHDWNCYHNTLIFIFTLIIFYDHTQNKTIYWIESHQSEKNQAKVKVVPFDIIITHDWNCYHNTIVSIYTVIIFYPQNQKKFTHRIELHWNKKNLAKAIGDHRKTRHLSICLQSLRRPNLYGKSTGFTSTLIFTCTV